MTYVEGSIKGYLDDLAGRKPAPGGGSAAGLEAALGCALISMVANFTISNKRYEEFKDRAAADLSKSEELRKRLLNLVDEDVKAYARLSDGFKRFGKDSPELGKMYREACDIPFEVCNIASEGLTLCRELVEYANMNLITDIAIAALMLESAFHGAKFNVYINLKYIKDKGYCQKIKKVISGFEETVPKLKEEILKICRPNF